MEEGERERYRLMLFRAGRFGTPPPLRIGEPDSDEEFVDGEN
jgi:hypothetical protein